MTTIQLYHLQNNAIYHFLLARFVRPWLDSLLKHFKSFRSTIEQFRHQTYHCTSRKCQISGSENRCIPRSNQNWDLLVSIWFVLGVTGSPCSRRKPDIGRLSQTFPDLAPLGPVWLEPGVCGRTLGPYEAVWQPD